MTEMMKFDYDALSLTPAERTTVEMSAGTIRTRMKRAATDIVEIGRELIKVKGILDHGQFLPWLEAEFGWTERTARNFMSVAESFKSENFADLDILPSVLYQLAAPTVPEGAREEVLERVEAGEKVSVKAAKEIVQAHKEADVVEVSDEEATSEIPPWLLKDLMDIEALVNFGDDAAWALIARTNERMNQSIHDTELRFAMLDRLSKFRAKMRQMEALAGKAEQVDPQAGGESESEFENWDFSDLAGRHYAKNFLEKQGTPSCSDKAEVELAIRGGLDTRGWYEFWFCVGNLTTTPPTDINFLTSIKEATLEEISMALEIVADWEREGQEGHKTRRTRLEVAKRRYLESVTPEPQPQPEPEPRRFAEVVDWKKLSDKQVDQRWAALVKTRDAEEVVVWNELLEAVKRTADNSDISDEATTAGEARHTFFPATRQGQIEAMTWFEGNKPQQRTAYILQWVGWVDAEYEHLMAVQMELELEVEAEAENEDISPVRIKQITDWIHDLHFALHEIPVSTDLEYTTEYDEIARKFDGDNSYCLELAARLEEIGERISVLKEEADSLL